MNGFYDISLATQKPLKKRQGFYPTSQILTPAENRKVGKIEMREKKEIRKKLKSKPKEKYIGRQSFGRTYMLP